LQSSNFFFIISAKLGSIEDAWRVFNKMPSSNVVTWIAMILGDAQCGQGQKALHLFRQMQQEGVQPNFITFLGVLKACSSVVALEEGRCVHQQIIQSGLESYVFVRSTLVDMYAKCGRIQDACRVQQDAISKCGHLDCHGIWTCNAGKGKNQWNYLNKCNRRVCNQTLEFLWGLPWWTRMQNVGVLRMLGGCSTICHIEMWSLGPP
jgi:pentatricopeptide repeat protein